MVSKTFWLSSLLVSAVTVTAKPTAKFGCGTPEPTENDLANTMALAAFESETVRSGNMSIFSNPIVVPTYFHVVASSTSLADGYLTVLYLSRFLDHVMSSRAADC